MSIVLVVTAFPRPEHRAEVIAAFEKAIPQVHNEPGVEFYALHEADDRLVMIEKYESEEAQTRHGNGTALAELRSALDGKLAAKLDVQRFTPHPAGDARKGALPGSD